METKKVTLKISDRFGILQLLPKQGSYVQLQIAKRLSELLNFSVGEMEQYEMKSEPRDGGISVKWNEELDKGVEFEFSRLEANEISDRLNEADSKKQLTQAQMNAFALFCAGGANA